MGTSFKTSDFDRSLCQAQILIHEIWSILRGLKFSPSLISNKLKCFEYGFKKNS